MKILRKIALIVLGLIVVALAVVFFSFNALIKKGVETAGPMALKAETRLGSSRIMPLSGGGSLHKLFVGNPEGFKAPHALKVHALHVKVDLASVQKPVVVIPSVRIESPDIYIEGSLTGKNNLRALQKNVEAFTAGLSQPKPDQPADKKKPAKQADKEAAKKVVIRELVITGAKVRWVSSLTLGQEVLLPLPDIRLKNLGEDKMGMTWGDLADRLVNELLKASSKVSTDNAAKALEQVKEQGRKSVEKATDSVKSLWKK